MALFHLLKTFSCFKTVKLSIWTLMTDIIHKNRELKLSEARDTLLLFGRNGNFWTTTRKYPKETMSFCHPLCWLDVLPEFAFSCHECLQTRLESSEYTSTTGHFSGRWQRRQRVKWMKQQSGLNEVSIEGILCQKVLGKSYLMVIRFLLLLLRSLILLLKITYI
jgi:hypothetical protein